MLERLVGRREAMKTFGTWAVGLAGTIVAPGMINRMATRKEVRGLHGDDELNLISPADNSILFGGYYPNKWAPEYGEFYKRAGVLNEFIDLVDSDLLKVEEMKSWHEQGKIPMVSLHSVNKRFTGDLAAQEEHIRKMWRPLRELDCWMRPMFEMNIPYFTHGIGYISPDKYIERFKIMSEWMRIDIPKAKIVWCPYAGKPFSDWYPGDEFVDMVGLDVYNRSSNVLGPRIMEPNMSFRNLVASSLREMKKLTDKPLILAEVGIDALNPAAARWMSEMLAIAPQLGFEAVCLFARNKFNGWMEADWDVIRRFGKNIFGNLDALRAYKR